MQRYKEHRRVNITLSHFLLVVDYQRFKVIVGNVILNQYIFLKKYCIISHIILLKNCIFKNHEIGGIKILSNVCKIGKD